MAALVGQARWVAAPGRVVQEPVQELLAAGQEVVVVQGPALVQTAVVVLEQELMVVEQTLTEARQPTPMEWITRRGLDRANSTNYLSVLAERWAYLKG